MAEASSGTQPVSGTPFVWLSLLCLGCNVHPRLSPLHSFSARTCTPPKYRLDGGRKAQLNSERRGVTKAQVALTEGFPGPPYTKKSHAPPNS